MRNSTPLILLLTPLIVVLGLTPGRAAAAEQTLAPPTRNAVPSTPAQETAIRAGIRLHDQSKYDEAIAQYEAVLKENPDDMTALFELAYSQLAKEEYQKVLDTARRGTQYRSDLLPMFYDVIGSALDSMGNHEQAIATYKRGIELSPDAGLYFNMAVTYNESLKNPEQARLALEQSIMLDPERPDADLLLGQLFQSGGYRTQALLAIGRYLIQVPNGNRSLQAWGLWRALLRGTSDTALTGTMQTPAKPVKMDEGDFTALDAYIDVTHAASAVEQDKGVQELVAMVGQVDAFLTRVAVPTAATRSSFTGIRYVPYFAELKQRGFVEPFVYWSSQRAPVAGAREWVDANRPRVQEFLKWSAEYKWP